jgi:5-formyltetrahydrofolate cyclo-ligase
MTANCVRLEEKKLLRREIRARLAEVSASDRRAFSSAAGIRLLEQESFRNAQCILAYSPLTDELDLSPALDWARAAGKTIALPRFVPEERAYRAALAEQGMTHHPKGAFGVVEPPPGAPLLSWNQLDFVLVPGLAFDPGGRRLGRGKGFYDRLLAEITCLKCGVALEAQILPRVPADAHDISMNFILTPTRWLVCSPAEN